MAECTIAMSSITLNKRIALMHACRSQDLGGTFRSSRPAANKQSRLLEKDPVQAAGPSSGDAAVIHRVTYRDTAKLQ